MAWFNDFGASKKFRLGTRKRDVAGSEFIFLTGVASTTANDVVTYDEDFLTTLSTANAVGPVAVAQSACVASKYGWYQVWGNSVVNTDAAVAADVQMFLTSTAGDVDDADVAGDTIIGMVSVAVDVSCDTTTAVWLSYPFCTNVAID